MAVYVSMRIYPQHFANPSIQQQEHAELHMATPSYATRVDLFQKIRGLQLSAHDIDDSSFALHFRCLDACFSSLGFTTFAYHTSKSFSRSSLERDWEKDVIVWLNLEDGGRIDDDMRM
jgi:hypothetical protein